MFKQSINHFMWAFQQSFQDSAQTNADFVFRRLSERITSEVFLVGFLEHERHDWHPICVEPEDHFWLLPEHLIEVLATAITLQGCAKESQMFHSLPQAQENHVRATRRRSIQEATEIAIRNTPNKPEEREYFVGPPVAVDGYSVMVVIGLKTDDIIAYPRLRSDEYWLHEHRSYKIPRSMIEAVVQAFLSQCSEELCKPDPGANFSFGSTQHVLEAAAKNMVCGLARRCDIARSTNGSEQDVFDCVLKIAAIGYERTAARGNIVLARKDHPAIHTRVSFSNPVPLANSRGVRKLLEMTRNNPWYLHTNSTVVWGLVEVDAPQMKEDDETLFKIVFVDAYVWECRSIKDRLLLQIENGVPRLSAKSVDRDALRADLIRLFPEIEAAVARKYLNLIEAASKQEHGTIVVISADPENEASRLAKQSTPIAPAELDEKIVLAVSGIDGAILLGTDGKCHSLGVILDGEANQFGDPARGARFNSAVRYVYRENAPACMAFIVSEDGGVDVVTQPAARKS